MTMFHRLFDTNLEPLFRKNKINKYIKFKKNEKKDTLKAPITPPHVFILKIL